VAYTNVNPTNPTTITPHNVNILAASAYLHPTSTSYNPRFQFPVKNNTPLAVQRSQRPVSNQQLQDWCMTTNNNSDPSSYYYHPSNPASYVNIPPHIDDTLTTVVDSQHHTPTIHSNDSESTSFGNHHNDSVPDTDTNNTTNASIATGTSTITDNHCQPSGNKNSASSSSTNTDNQSSSTSNQKPSANNTTRYKTQPNYHCKENCIGIGSKVYARIGKASLQHPSHKLSTRSKVYRTVRKSLPDKKWLVTFEDGTKRDMKYTQIFLTNDNDAVTKAPAEAVEAQDDREDEYKEQDMTAYTFLSPLFGTPQLSQDKVYSDNSNENVSKCNEDEEDNDEESISDMEDIITNDHDSVNDPSSSLSDLNEYELKLYHSNIRLKNLTGKKVEVVSGSQKQREKVKWIVIEDSTPHTLHTTPRSHAYLGIRSQEVLDNLRYDSVLPLAELYLYLSYRGGNWKRWLELLNKKIEQYNELLPIV
jgi:hypothetical protein